MGRKRVISKREPATGGWAKRQVLVKALIVLILVTGVVVLLGIGAFSLLSAEFLKVRNFSIEGNRYLSDREVIRLMKVEGKNIILLDTEITEDSEMGQFLWRFRILSLVLPAQGRLLYPVS